MITAIPPPIANGNHHFFRLSYLSFTATSPLMMTIPKANINKNSVPLIAQSYAFSLTYSVFSRDFVFFLLVSNDKNTYYLLIIVKSFIKTHAFSNPSTPSKQLFHPLFSLNG